MDNNQSLGPIFDSDGNYNPERAQQEWLEREQQEQLNSSQNIPMQDSGVLGPIFDSDGNYNPEKAQQEWLEREQQELLASQIVDQMANQDYQSDELEFPGNVLK